MTTSPQSYITPEMRAYIGTKGALLVSPPVSASDIRRFAMAAYWPKVPPRLFWDEEYARKTRWKGIIAPAEFNPFAWMVGRAHIGPQPEHIDERQRREEEARQLRPPGAPERYLYGGSTAEYFAPMRPGDVITSVVSLTDLFERTGRLGLMLFYVLEERWTNQRNELVKTFRSDNILY
jgi:acyl dehydratase